MYHRTKHTVLFNLIDLNQIFAILSGFSYIMVSSDLLITMVSIFPLLIILFITILEIAVAVIQAYVFAILCSIYVADALHIH